MEILIIVNILITLIVLISLVVVFFRLRKKPENGNIEGLSEVALRIKDFNEKLANIEKQLLVELQKSTNVNLEKSFERYKEQDLLLKTGIKDLQGTLEKKLEDINSRVNVSLEKGFADANKTFKDVMESITRIEEAKKKMEDLSVQVIGLQDILQNSQARGQYGEFQLGQILDSVFEGNKELYQMQYSFKNGDNNVRVDAVVFMKDANKMICIDSKFPFSNYRTLADARDESIRKEALKAFKDDVKYQIKDISEKYIVPGETFAQAFMFLPSDGILATIHQELPEIIEEARKRNVMLASPATLLPTLAAIRNVNITIEKTKQVEIIHTHLIRLGANFKKFGEDWDKFAGNLNKTLSGSDMLSRRIKRIRGEFDSINGGQIEEIDENREEIFESIE